MNISFHTDTSSYRLPDKRRVRSWIAEVVRREGFELGEVAYIFCGRERHLEINMEYLGHDYPTDVITFDYTADGVVSGDIFIDPQTVRENARRFGVTAREEMLRVVVHGVLHLCGHGDKTPAEERTMHALEDKYLMSSRTNVRDLAEKQDLPRSLTSFRDDKEKKKGEDDNQL